MTTIFGKGLPQAGDGASAIAGWRSVSCAREGISSWRIDLMVYPTAAVAPVLDLGLAEDPHDDHDKTRGIVAHSVRNAVALLPACVQRLSKRS